MEILKSVFKELFKISKRRGIYLGLSHLISIILIYGSISILNETMYAGIIIGSLLGGLICLVLFLQGFVTFIDTIIYQVKTWDNKSTVPINMLIR